MPELTNHEIETGIGNGSIYALAIDTSVFDRFGCDLRHPKLKLLHQFSESKVELVLPEIVEREVLAHIARNMGEAQLEACKAMIEYRRRWHLEEEGTSQFEADAVAAAGKQLRHFMAMSGAKSIPLTGGDDLAVKAVGLYFSSTPPFEKREQKKHEFPDALALLSLEALADRRGRMILCVSADKGWQAFCAGSEDLVWIGDLDTALSFFHSSGRARAEEIWRSLRERGRNSLFYDPIHLAFRARLRTADFIPELRSSLDSIATAMLEELDEVDLATATAPLVIEADAKAVTFTFKVKANVIFHAEFDFYPSHSIGEEQTAIISVEREVEKILEYEVLLTVLREGNAMEAVRSVFVERPRTRIDFGAIDPFAL